MDVKIQEQWKEVLKEEFEKDYFINLTKFLHEEKKDRKVIYPPGKLIFNAFELTPFNDVKIVILGQDPYHGPNQAHGLSFSVPNDIPAPPSLKNIYKEIETDLNIELDKNGNLEGWAKQGIFLLNSVLTVRASEPTSHSKVGWNEFTDAVIKAISDKKEGIIFLLWGNYARTKRELIDMNKHYVLEAPHPSPLARGAFFGCRHFSKCNEILTSLGKNPINWSL